MKERRDITWVLLGLTWLVAAVPARAQDATDQLEALRVGEPPVIDGVLDDRAWERAGAVSGFTQRSPAPGEAAPAATEVAVAYDARYLYVAFRCEGAPAATLSVRDNLVSEADYVMVYVDGALDRRNARLFAVTAAGVQAEGTLSFDSPSRDHAWDSVWRSAVDTRAGDRWSAELAIPHGLLGLAEAEPRIGIHFRRYFAEGNVVVERDAVPHTSNTYVSHFEVVGPLRNVTTTRSVELRPYVRVDLRPRVADGAALRRDPLRLRSGGDLRIALGSDLGLYVAVLPDFGEAEIDSAVLNLSAYETYYSEQRQIFLEEADLFRFPNLTGSHDQIPWQLVHTRRIGARPAFPDLADDEELQQMDDVAPVEAVVRMAGQVREGTEVGVLGALVGPAQAVVVDEGGAERTVEAAERHYFAVGRLRQRLGSGRSTIGGAVTAMGPLDDVGEYAGAVDFDLNPSRGNHRLVAVGGATYAEGEPGWGYNVTAGRFGGEGFRWRLTALAESENFDVNGLGWMRRNDRIGFSWKAGFVLDGLAAPLRQISGQVWGEQFFNFDGVLNASGQGIQLLIGIWDRDSVEFYSWISNPHMDDLETRGGPLLRRPASIYVWSGLRSALGRPFRISVSVNGSTGDYGRSIGTGADLRWSPARVFTLTMSTSYSQQRESVRWLEDVAAPPVDGVDLDETLEIPLLARMNLDVFRLSLRSTLALTPNLSLQAFVQLLASAAGYNEFLHIDGDSLAQAETPDSSYDWDSVVLLANVVLRWEARPGTVLYAVYTHSGNGSGDVGLLDIPSGLRDAAWSNGSDLFLLKLELTFL